MAKRKYKCNPEKDVTTLLEDISYWVSAEVDEKEIKAVIWALVMNNNDNLLMRVIKKVRKEREKEMGSDYEQ
jgi:hypothetical protein